jgi:hypothetical protein
MAAYQYAEQVRAENSQMKQRLEQLGKGYQSEQEGRINAQEVQAKRALTEAYEAVTLRRVLTLSLQLLRLLSQKSVFAFKKRVKRKLTRKRLNKHNFKHNSHSNRSVLTHVKTLNCKMAV